jgi:serine protease Do
MQISWRHTLLIVGAAWLTLAAQQATAAPPTPSPAAAAASAPAPAPIPAIKPRDMPDMGDGTDAPPAPNVSRDARLAYESARGKLLQIRTLRRKTNTQSSVGSGFYVSSDGLIITNFHVASALALEPTRHRGVAVSVEGKEIELDLLAFDIRNDLALLRPHKAVTGQTALALRPQTKPVERGERIYSLGNPLDIGFAVTEGNFNGLVQRSFYPRIFFGGALNPGMSGGPSIDNAGRVIGVNVAKRNDADLVSFLIPVEFVAQLVERGAKAKPIVESAEDEVTRQLTAHQNEVIKRFTSTQFRFESYGGYKVPVPDETLARCWGNGRDRNSKSQMDFERSDCSLDSGVFAGDFSTGTIQMRYEAYDGSRLEPLQFAYNYGQSFKNEYFPQRGTRHKTAVECTERYVQTKGMPLRAVMCMSAYRKLQGLYDMSLLVNTLNQPQRGVQGRVDATGLTFENAMLLSQRYMDALSWEPKP